MNFRKILELLEEGFKVRRTHMCPTAYVYYRSAWGRFRIIDRDLGDDYVFSTEDILAKDWEKVTECELKVVGLIPKITYPVYCPNQSCHKLVTAFDTLNHNGEIIKCPNCSEKFKLGQCTLNGEQYARDNIEKYGGTKLWIQKE